MRRICKPASCALLAVLVLSACGSRDPKVPAPFEIIGKSKTDGGTLYVVRDNGTGCELVLTDSGVLLPRNERAADGSSVKQRCVITGDEAPAPDGVATQGTTADVVETPFTHPLNQIGPEAQEEALREAVRQQAQAGLGGGDAPAAPVIPPPRLNTAGQPAKPAAEARGIEAQLKR